MASIYTIMNPNNLVIAAILCDTIPDFLKYTPNIFSKSLRNTVKQYVTPCARFMTAISLASRLSVMPNSSAFDSLLSLAGVTHLWWSSQADMLVENTYDSAKLADQIYKHIQEDILSRSNELSRLEEQLVRLEPNTQSHSRKLNDDLTHLTELEQENHILDVESQGYLTTPKALTTAA